MASSMGNGSKSEVNHVVDPDGEIVIRVPFEYGVAVHHMDL